MTGGRGWFDVVVLWPMGWCTAWAVGMWVHWSGLRTADGAWVIKCGRHHYARGSGRALLVFDVVLDIEMGNVPKRDLHGIGHPVRHYAGLRCDRPR